MSTAEATRRQGRRTGPALFLAVTGSVLIALLLVVLGTRLTGLPPLGELLDPWDGLYRNARATLHPPDAERLVEAVQEPVTIVRDERGVPHIFAASDRDATVALGYVVAQDRLFQLDFIPRAASGRLSEAFGPSALDTDRFLRSTGMDWGARRTLAHLEEEGGIERDLVEWYAAGVNAYLDGLDASELPLEFRLLGYRPDRYDGMQIMRILQYMNFDLSFYSDEAVYGILRERLSDADYALLYPQHSRLFVPIIPEGTGGGASFLDSLPPRPDGGALAALSTLWDAQRKTPGAVTEGWVRGKGSNNWAVGPGRAAAGAPMLAGDMHLRLSLPAIWYEAHIVTPSMNVYGVTIPGAPLLVEAFSDDVAWAFTNTGADQIDHYALTLDEAGERYLHEGAWRPLTLVADTIRIKGEEAVVDTLAYAHWGPVVRAAGGAVALQWTAHYPSNTLGALWGMLHADDYAAFEDAIRLWDTPMQNIVYAGRDGTIAIRSTGHLPVRRGGHGMGLLDGTTDAHAWDGRVPFEALPHSIDPAQGFLTSTNQQPAAPGYPYYLNHDWEDAYRSLRIDSLLRGRPSHGRADMMRYQADTHAVQRGLFTPLLDTLTGLSAPAEGLRRQLSRWDGAMAADRAEPLILHVFMEVLEALAWDEAVFRGARRPVQTQLLYLLNEAPASEWLDVQATPARENAAALLRAALDTTLHRLQSRYGEDPAAWRWGDDHQLQMMHLTRSEALRPLWRGPFPVPGYKNTLAPFRGEPVATNGASWRVVVDFSESPPAAFGIYPGGQSGNPMHPHYDAHIEPYLDFSYYPLLRPPGPDALPPGEKGPRLVLRPPER